MCLSSTAVAPTTSTAKVSPTATADNNLNLNRKWILKRRPLGVFDPQLDAELVVGDSTNDQQQGALEDTQIVVQPQLLSVDAFLRTMFDEGAYHGSLPVGATIPALGYGRVVKAGSKSGHKVGSTVAGMLAAADQVTVEGNQAMRCFHMPFGLGRKASLGLLGMTSGLTAYCGVFHVPSRAPRKGETVVVTGAAGAVGSIAIQLCKSTGARVIGVAGGQKKGDYLMNDLNCDGVIDYKNTSNVSLNDQIAATCPDGIDFIYDNVGGSILDALLFNINAKGRVVICGAISQYSGNLHNSKGGDYGNTIQGPSSYLKLAEKGAEMRGFNVMQHLMKLPFMMVGMIYLWARGKVVMNEHIEEGLEQFPHALQKLFTGKTIGKTLVRVRPDDYDVKYVE